MEKRSAITKINRSGVLLVFPVNNAKDPNSLWSEFFPRTKMKWDWNEEGDTKVSDMWHLMKRLSDCRDVVYSKWYRGRATFFSRDLFSALIRIYAQSAEAITSLSESAKTVLEILEMDSPLSTREIKKMARLQGKVNEGTYNRATNELFLKFLVVGFGEVDDGAFPSLAMGATRTLFEDLWSAAKDTSTDQAKELIQKHFAKTGALRRFLDKMTVEN